MRSPATALAFSAGLALAAACATPPIEDDLGAGGDVTLPERTKTDAPDSGTSTGAKEGGTTQPPANVNVTVTLSGGGTGTVTSTPAGLTCTGTTCTGSFARGTQVTLQAAPGAGVVFTAWGGACTGTASCVATANADVAATAELVSLDGTWSGTYTNTRNAVGCTFNNKGNLSTTMKTTAPSVAGTETITGLELRQLSGCTVVGSTTGAAPSEPVTVAGATLTGTYTFDVQGGGGKLAFPYTATVTAKAITGKWTCATCTGGFTLSKP
jgi:hypothetical protein